MQAYNLEIFTPKFVLKDHATVSDVNFVFDYLAPEESIIDVPNGINVAVGDYIKISDDICGVVTNLDRQRTYQIAIYYKPFTSLLDVDVMFDTDWQGVGALEDRLAQLITDYLISNEDTEQNVMGLSVTTTSSTTDWGFNLKALTEGTHKLIIGLYETLMKRSLTEYEVSVSVDVDFQEKTIDVTIGKIEANQHIIEADLSNIIFANISLDEREFAINKLVMYDNETLTQIITYYLHSDGTYDTNDEDRIFPVEYKIEAIYTESGGSFADAARSRAREVFGSEKINNLIEIETQPNDSLVRTEELKIGQTVTVLANGKAYTSLVTGKKLSNTTTLILGAVRLDLTKMIGG